MDCEHKECEELAMSGYGRAGYYLMGMRFCPTCKYYTLETADRCPGCNQPFRLEPIYQKKEPLAVPVRTQLRV